MTSFVITQCYHSLKKGKRKVKNIDRTIQAFRVEDINSEEKTAPDLKTHSSRPRYFSRAFARSPTVKRAMVALSVAGTVGMPHFRTTALCRLTPAARQYWCFHPAMSATTQDSNILPMR